MEFPITALIRTALSYMPPTLHGRRNVARFLFVMLLLVGILSPLVPLNASSGYCSSDDTDCQIAAVQAATAYNYRLSRNMDRVGSLIGGVLALGISYWGYNVGQKVHGGATRDFCNFSAVLFGVKGVILLWGGAD